MNELVRCLVSVILTGNQKQTVSTNIITVIIILIIIIITMTIIIIS